MNILDINDLPTITMQISGREGVASGAWVINQEKKQRLELGAGDISYTAGEVLIIQLTDSNFISSIESDTTLSVIVFSGNIPLYRDIVKFRGQLDSVDFYSQYNHSGDYYVFGEDEESDDESTGIIDGGSGSGDTYTPPDEAGNLVISDFAIKFDLDNDGLGEINNGGDGTLSQQTYNVLGDFKVRTDQYGTFTASPTSLEEVQAFSYLYDKNSGNPSGWGGTITSNNPELEGYYYHFSAGVSQTANDKIMEIATDRELGLTSTTDLSVFKEDSTTDWEVGMSVYKDISGTPIMDGVTSPWDRFNFIYIDSNNDIVVVRSTDNIVTHVEVAKNTTYLKYMEMFSVGIVTSPYSAAPRPFADYVTWFEDKVNDVNSTVSYNSTRPTEFSKRRIVIDYSNGSMVSIGDIALKRDHGWNGGQTLASDVIGIELDPSSAGSVYQLGTSACTADGVNFLIREIDFTTGLVTNFQWYTLT